MSSPSEISPHSAICVKDCCQDYTRVLSAVVVAEGETSDREKKNLTARCAR